MTTPQTLGQLLDQIHQTGRPVDIEFAPYLPNEFGVEDLENYAAVGMRARITGGRHMQDDTSVLEVDFEPFESHNRGFETTDFYGRGALEGKLVSAREAGCYRPQDTLYVPSSLPVSRLFHFLNPMASALWAEWQAQSAEPSAAPMSYTQYLEQQVQTLRDQVNAKPSSEAPSSEARRPRLGR